MNIFCLTSVFLLIQLHGAQLIEDEATPNCKVSGISDDEWDKLKIIEDIINDNETDRIIFEGVPENIKNGQYCADYFCITSDDKSFKIIPSSKFSDIDGDSKFKSACPTTQVVQTIRIPCTSGMDRPLTFNITVKDTNNHAPSFSEASYSYTLPMPMLPKNNITNFGNEIIVQDLDFSNQYINISSTFEGLIFTIEENDHYSYKIQLQFSGLKKLKSPTNLTLEATDSGTPPLSSNITVFFNIDEMNSEPPSFTKPSYLYDYDPNASKIIARSGQKAMLEAARKGLECKIQEAEYSTYFNDVGVNDQKIDLSLKKPFDDDIVDKLIAQITVECHGSKDTGLSSADIIIYFQASNTEEVTFSKKKYSAKYEIKGDIHDIQMEDKITLTKTSDEYEIIVEDSLSEYFGLKEEANAGWTLVMKKYLDQDTLKNTAINIIIKLLRKIDKNLIDDAFITLLLPNGEEGVYFNEPFFIGDYEYDDDGTGTLNPIAIELNSKDLDVVSCGLEENKYSEYFQPSCTGPNDLKITLKDNIPEGLLKSSIVPLSMWVLLQLGNIERNISSAIILNLSYKGTPMSSTSATTDVTPKPDSQDECSNTGWIIAVIVLAILLVIYIAATMLYYFRRLRNRNEVDYIPEPKRITPKIQPRISEDKKYKNVSTRRPTGFIRFNPDLDRSSIDSDYGDQQKEVENNTNANKFLNDTEELDGTISDSGNGNRKNIGFNIPPPPPEPPFSHKF